MPQSLGRTLSGFWCGCPPTQGRLVNSPTLGWRAQSRWDCKGLNGYCPEREGTATPSTETISRPAIKQMGTRQLLIARYVERPCESRSAMATEHAPQSPSAQPSFEPVKPCARRYSSKVVFGEQPSILSWRPFRVNSMAVPIKALNQHTKGRVGGNGLRESASLIVIRPKIWKDV